MIERGRGDSRPLVRGWLLVTGVFAAITVALTYPLVRVIGSAFPQDAGDPVLNTWILWWSTQKMPLTSAWWNAPMFYPMVNAMALSELLIGLLPITAPIQWLTHNPLLAYNVAFLLSFPLSGLAAYTLALELTGRRDAAFLAGLAFAFGPYRMDQLSHLQMLAYYWAPVSLWGLHRYLRTRRFVWLAVFAGAWLLQALSNGYALFHLSVLLLLWLAWFVRDIEAVSSIGLAWGCAALPLIVPLLRYRDVHGRMNLARDINEIRGFSADIASFLSAPTDLSLWGGRLLANRFEAALFPGVTIVAVLLVAGTLAFRHRVREEREGGRSVVNRDRVILAAVATLSAATSLSVLWFGPWAVGKALTVSSFNKPFSIAVLAWLLYLGRSAWWRRAWRLRSVPMFYAASALAMNVLAFGPSPMVLGREVLYKPPYAWLLALPGFAALRVPARFAMLALLCQATLAALAFARWCPRRGSLRSVALTVIGVGLVADGWIRLPLIAAPGPGPASADHWAGSRPGRRVGVKAVMELPPGEPIVDFSALYRSMADTRRLVNGYSGYAPPHYLPLVYALGHGQFAALDEMAAYGPIGIMVDRSLHWHEEMEASVSRLASVTPLEISDQWATYVVAVQRQPAVHLGPRVTPVDIRVNRKDEDVTRLADGRVESAWGPGTPQDGHEEVLVELASAQSVAAIVLEMGSYAFGFPRELAIDLSTDGNQFQTVWQGETAALTVRAALADPDRVPLTLEIRSRPTRFIRLRQVGHDATVPWWIAELHIHGPDD